MFKKYLSKTHNLEDKGNFRVVQPIDTQDPKLITNWSKETEVDYFWLLVVLIVLVSEVHCFVHKEHQLIKQQLYQFCCS
jgi:hypothetical protein